MADSFWTLTEEQCEYKHPNVRHNKNGDNRSDKTRVLTFTTRTAAKNYSQVVLLAVFDM